MKRQTVCVITTIGLLGPAAGAIDPVRDAQESVRATAWEVSETVRDASHPGGVSCTIRGWEPLTYDTMDPLRARVQSERMLRWYRDTVPEPEREELIERFLDAYGLASAGEIEFSQVQADYDMESLSEHENAFIGAVGWCLLDRDEYEREQHKDWVDELIRRLEALADEGPPLRSVGLWESCESTLDWLDDPRLGEIQERAERQLIRACSHPDLGFADREHLWRKYVMDRAHSSDLETREAWLARLDAAPQMDPWIEHHSRGAAMVKLAWELRGNKLASRTSRGQFRGFSGTLQIARDHLVTAWEFDPRLARTATEMIAVTMGGEGVPGLDEFDWFARATAAQVDYSNAYSKLVYAMHPKWGGSHEIMGEIAMSCTLEGYKHTWVPRKGLDAFNSILLDSAEWENGDWLYEHPRFASGYVDLLDSVVENTDTLSEKLSRSFRSRAAIVATMTGDLEDAERRLRELGEDYYVSTSRYMRLYGFRPHSEVFPFTGVASENATKASMADRIGMSGLAIEHWSEGLGVVRELTPDDTLAIRAFEDRLESSRIRNAYESGDWVGVGVIPSGAGIRMSHAMGVEALEDGVVRVHSTIPNEVFHLYPNLETGLQYEVEVSLRPTQGMPEDFEFGVLFNAGLSDWNQDPFANFQFSVSEQHASMGIGRSFKWTEDWRGVEPDDDGWYHFTLAYDEGVIRASVNEQSLGRHVRSDLGGPNPFESHAGISLTNHNGQAIELKNLRIRKIPEKIEVQESD